MNKWISIILVLAFLVIGIFALHTQKQKKYSVSCDIYEHYTDSYGVCDIAKCNFTKGEATATVNKRFANLIVRSRLTTNCSVDEVSE